MKLLFGLFSAAIAASLFTAGCTGGEPPDKFVAKTPDAIPAATVTPGNEGTLMPLDKGNQWTYSVAYVTKVNGQDQPQRTYDTVWTVTQSSQSNGVTTATIQSVGGSEKNDLQSWRLDSTGLYEVADGSPQVSFNPPFPVLKFPIKDDSQYSWKGTGPNGTSQGGPQTSLRTLRGSEEVDTDMGQMSAIAVDDSGTLDVKGKPGTSSSTLWFTPGVGIVRLRQEVLVGNNGYVMLLKLKSKSLMKS